MNVGDLLDLLLQLPQDAEVVIVHADWELKKVKLEKEKVLLS